MNKAPMLGLCAVLFLASPGFGHAKLLASDPAAGKTVTAPRFLTLTFNEKVRLATLTVTSDGRAVPVRVDRDAPAAATVSIALPPLTMGDYDVQWSALTPSDGHVVKGRYSFVVR